MTTRKPKVMNGRVLVECEPSDEVPMPHEEALLYVGLFSMHEKLDNILILDCMYSLSLHSSENHASGTF